MDFNAFFNQAWSDHAKDSRAVAGRMAEGAQLATSGSELAQLMHLVTHIFGEHLGEWAEGERELDKLVQHKNLQWAEKAALARAKATLRLGRDAHYIPRELPISDQARAMAAAASAQAAHGHLLAATELLHTVKEICDGLTTDDPAQRALAVTANNLCCTLEEKTSRTSEESETMLYAARLALLKWGEVGDWRQKQSAEYRMAKALLQAKRPEEARTHALACLEILEGNSAGVFDFFSVRDCFATIEWMVGNQKEFLQELSAAETLFNSLSDEEKQWAGLDMEKLRALI